MQQRRSYPFYLLLLRFKMQKKLLALFPIIPEATEGYHVQSADVRTAGVCVSLGRVHV